MAAIPAVRAGAAGLPARFRRSARPGRGAGRARHRHRGLPRRRRQALRRRQPGGAGPAPTGSCRRGADESIYQRVLQDMKERDARDSERTVAPLMPADDAFVLDTTRAGCRRGVRRGAGGSSTASSPSQDGKRNRLSCPRRIPGIAAGARLCRRTCRTRLPAHAATARPVGKRSGVAHGRAPITPTHAKESFAALLDESLGAGAGLEGTRRQGHRRRASRTISSLIDVGLKSEGRVPLKEFASAGQRARDQGRRHGRGLLERMEDKQRRGHAVAREGAPRGSLDRCSKRPSRTTSASPASSSAASRAASPSISPAPWPSCPAARSISARCATSAR